MIDFLAATLEHKRCTNTKRPSVQGSSPLANGCLTQPATG